MLFKKKLKVLCIGSVGKDIFFPVDSSFSVEKQNSSLCFALGSKVHIKDRFVALGGCACNLAVGLARAGIYSSILSLAGGDSDGDWIKKSLVSEKVDVKKFQQDKNANTDLSVIVVDSESGERTIFVNRDVGEKLKIKEEVFSDFDWVFVGSLYGENLQKNVEIIHDKVKNSHFKLVYNPGQNNITENQKEVHSLLFHTSLLFVNKTEAQQIVKFLKTEISENSLNSEEELLKVLFENMADGMAVILTDGNRGAWCFDGKKNYYEGASTGKILDTTGAGDAFSSGFFSAILLGHSSEKAMKWGMQNSFSVIRYYGAIEGLLKKEAFLKI